MPAEKPLQDPFGGSRWFSPQKWIDGANTSIFSDRIRAAADAVVNRDLSVDAQFDAAKHTAAHEAAGVFAGPDIDHVVIGTPEEPSLGSAKVGFEVTLKPNAPDIALPSSIPARDEFGEALPYSFPVTVRRLDSDIVPYAFAGGEIITGQLNGICGFSFAQRDGTHYFVTNAHVLTQPGQSPQGMPCYYGHLHIGYGSHGDALRTTGRNTLDAALVELRGYLSDPLTINRANGSITDYYDIVRDSGPLTYVAGNHTTHCTPVGRVEPPYSIELTFPSGAVLEYTSCWKLRWTGGSPPRRGHSGSVLFTRASRGLIFRGLLFAGTESGSDVYAFNASSVWARFFPAT